jgi:hypothetical protein
VTRLFTNLADANEQRKLLTGLDAPARIIVYLSGLLWGRRGGGRYLDYSWTNTSVGEDRRKWRRAGPIAAEMQSCSTSCSSFVVSHLDCHRWAVPNSTLLHQDINTVYASIGLFLSRCSVMIPMNLPRICPFSGNEFGSLKLAFDTKETNPPSEWMEGIRDPSPSYLHLRLAWPRPHGHGATTATTRHDLVGLTDRLLGRSISHRRGLDNRR